VADLLFYVLALGAIACSALVVCARMPMHSVLALLGSFFCLAGIYLLAGFQFLAATQLLVYAGAIMVLFLFVVMLLNLGDPAEVARNSGLALGGRRLAIAGAAAGLLTLIGVAAAGFPSASASEDAPAGQEAIAVAEAAGLDDLVPLAEVLFTRYLLPFEASSLLLLATMIAVIALAKRARAPLPPGTGERAGDGAGPPRGAGGPA
jgi:NADH-quinone oxidoreductase subunit J